MDIEKLIEAVRLCGSTPKVDQCKQCAYWSGGDMSKCIPRMTTDAATALSTLQAENEKLRAELEQVKAERDAAVESIPHKCKTCVYHTVFFNGCTPDHDCINPDGGCSNNCDRWKWRGPQKED